MAPPLSSRYHRPLYDAIHGGHGSRPLPFSSTVVELLGHPDPSFLASDAEGGRVI
jgi:hypothetical protein